ncbi:hypothetical protein [Bacteroides sp.]|uniref:hypothetical protein n=1 Tax=Bacteroides sp. TaxID=29523 RepID=UPI002587FBFC|nr:hypothetical protein [Bacteroides sp.]
MKKISNALSLLITAVVLITGCNQSDIVDDSQGEIQRNDQLSLTLSLNPKAKQVMSRASVKSTDKVTIDETKIENIALFFVNPGGEVIYSSSDVDLKSKDIDNIQAYVATISVDKEDIDGSYIYLVANDEKLVGSLENKEIKEIEELADFIAEADLNAEINKGIFTMIGHSTEAFDKDSSNNLEFIQLYRMASKFSVAVNINDFLTEDVTVEEVSIQLKNYPKTAYIFNTKDSYATVHQQYIAEDKLNRQTGEYQKKSKKVKLSELNSSDDSGYNHYVTKNEFLYSLPNDWSEDATLETKLHMTVVVKDKAGNQEIYTYPLKIRADDGSSEDCILRNKNYIFTANLDSFDHISDSDFDTYAVHVSMKDWIEDTYEFNMEKVDFLSIDVPELIESFNTTEITIPIQTTLNQFDVIGYVQGNSHQQVKESGIETYSIVLDPQDTGILDPSESRNIRINYTNEVRFDNGDKLKYELVPDASGDKEGYTGYTLDYFVQDDRTSPSYKVEEDNLFFITKSGNEYSFEESYEGKIPLGEEIVAMKIYSKVLNNNLVKNIKFTLQHKNKPNNAKEINIKQYAPITMETMDVRKWGVTPYINSIPNLLQLYKESKVSLDKWLRGEVGINIGLGIIFSDYKIPDRFAGIGEKLADFLFKGEQNLRRGGAKILRVHHLPKYMEATIGDIPVIQKNVKLTSVFAGFDIGMPGDKLIEAILGKEDAQMEFKKFSYEIYVADENKAYNKMVSPAFVLSPYDTKIPYMNLAQAQAVCAGMVMDVFNPESGVKEEISHFRLPTKAEIELIMRVQDTPRNFSGELIHKTSYWTTNTAVLTTDKIPYDLRVPGDDLSFKPSYIRCVKDLNLK